MNSLRALDCINRFTQRPSIKFRKHLSIAILLNRVNHDCGRNIMLYIERWTCNSSIARGYFTLWYIKVTQLRVCEVLIVNFLKNFYVKIRIVLEKNAIYQSMHLYCYVSNRYCSELVKSFVSIVTTFLCMWSLRIESYSSHICHLHNRLVYVIHWCFQHINFVKL